MKIIVVALFSQEKELILIRPKKHVVGIVLQSVVKGIKILIFFKPTPVCKLELNI